MLLHLGIQGSVDILVIIYSILALNIVDEVETRWSD